MIKFDLERALAGEEVMLGDLKVTQFQVFSTASWERFCGVVDGEFCSDLNSRCLTMAPKMGKGFLNVYPSEGLYFTPDPTQETIEACDKMAGNNRIMCIDLSQFPEGYGL